MPIVIPTKEEKEEMKTHPVTAGAKIVFSVIYGRANLFVLLTHQYILVYFFNNVLFHQYFLI